MLEIIFTALAVVIILLIWSAGCIVMLWWILEVSKVDHSIVHQPSTKYENPEGN